MLRSLIASVAAFALLSLAGAAQAALVFNVSLSGPAESPPNASPGLGFGTVTFDSVAHTMAIDITFSDLLGTTTASHIHCCTAVAGAGTAGVSTTTPTFAGFPLGVTSGHYVTTLDMTLASSYNPAYVTANGGTTASAEAALTAGAVAGRAYFNVHTSLFPGGEIRGFLTAVPEPQTWGLMIVGFGLTGAMLRRRRTLALA